MEKTIDCRGMACPLPVVNAKKTLEEFTEDGTLRVLVDNETAVTNLKKLASGQGFAAESAAFEEKDFCVAIQVKAGAGADACAAAAADAGGKLCVVISSNCMGHGKEELGKMLMKSFIFALTSQDTVPDYLICYNSGAYLTCEGSESLEDLKTLEDAGTKIMTCGTCLNFYELSDKLRIGIVSNMYDIVETQLKCSRIIHQ